MTPQYAIPVGLGLTKALVEALIAAGLAYLVSDIAYILAEEVASNVKKQTEYKYYEASRL